MRDAVSKNRKATGVRQGTHTHPEQIARGEQNGRARLSAEAVREIRRLYTEGGCSFRQLAARFGVVSSTVSMILHRKTWTHLSGLPWGHPNGPRMRAECFAAGDRNGSRTHPERVARGERKASAKLTESDVRAIRRLYAAGERTQSALAVQFGVCRRNIGMIVHHHRWKHI